MIDELSGFFRLLGEPSRLRLMCEIRNGSRDVATLMERTGFSQSHLSRQLSQLTQAGLVTMEKAGNRAFYAANDPVVEAICQMAHERLTRQLRQRLETLRGN
ncbi:MAG: metalloregulator ArsR/SmtB family transcription factor [Synechococcus sp.]|nr:metalloregulator ArsR/SmtB family transcription factor [Synechococcus sp.]